MRDIFFLGILPFLLYPMFKRPFIAVGMWVWTAMFFPNAWVYGIASGLRYNLIFTGIAILGYLAMKNKPKVQFGAIGGLIVLFFLWTTISTLTSIGDFDRTWDLYVRFFKVVLLFVFVVLIVEKKLHIDFFLWCIVFSVGFYAGLEALKFVVSGGGHKIEGFSGHVLGDRNELALAFVMTLPICHYLLGEFGRDNKIVKLGLLGLMGLIVTAVVGTQSRGGFIALLGLGGYLYIKSDRKILLTILIVGLAAVLANFVTDEWASRMDTIGDASEDSSFMGRVVAWKLSFIMAMQHPFFGGGFKSLEYLPVWLNLSQDFFSYSFFYTGDELPTTEKARAAHSIYFQVMGDHGFAGLAIFLSFIIIAFLSAGRIARAARRHDQTEWISRLATTLQLCIFAYCLGGAALSFAYFEVLYAICGLVIVLRTRILPAALPPLEAKRAL